GSGTGFIWDDRGHIVTNYHVIDTPRRGSASYTVTLYNQKTYPARLVGGEKRKDIAVLKIDAPAAELKAISVAARAAKLEVGQKAIAIGNPYGLDHTLTTGVISALGREVAGYGGVSIRDMIQTDASINLGNSGGPLVDVHGEVLGLTTAVRSDGQGVAFAIPAPMARKFLDEVWTYGRVRMARLGIRAVDIGPDQFPGRLSAVAITQVAEDGPGARAGLEVGDVVLAIDDQAVSRVSQVAYLTQLHGVGAQVEMQVKRGEEPVKRLQVIPTEVP
ncbi:MAG: S1C family serine protease, partial [Nannocystaceae bacterium]